MLIEPYGGRLVDLTVRGDEREELLARVPEMPSLRLSWRSVCDLELLAVGAFSPLDRFMGRGDYERVLEEMRLERGLLFPIPVTLPVFEGDFRAEWLDREVVLRSLEGEPLAVMRVEEAYSWEWEREAQLVYGTRDLRHPTVAEMMGWGGLYISGHLRVVNLPRRYAFRELYRTPRELRTLLRELGYSRVVGFQTRNPLHRSHVFMSQRAADRVGGALLIHPAVGMTKPGDVDAYTRIRCYQAVVRHRYDPGRTLLALLPLAMRMAGPREALWHGIIRRNFGATHFVVGRDHAGPGADAAGRPFYAPFAAQELFAVYQKELGVEMIPFDEVVYLPEEDRYEEVSRVPAGRKVWRLSGTQLREHLRNGEQLPEWFTYPEVEAVLREAFPPLHRRGFCVWFTGLPCAGKSTLAKVLVELLTAAGRRVSLLDGDVVRTHLSKGLGFSRQDREANLLRIAFVASEIVRHNGVAVCAAVSPYRDVRGRIRAMFPEGQFLLVYVDTPVEVCEARDVKGMYAAARRGLLKGFTGVDDPYEPPDDAEIVIRAAECGPEEGAAEIVNHLRLAGLLPPGEVQVPGLDPADTAVGRHG